MTIRRLQPEGRLAGAVIHGDTVYLAGQVADDPRLDAEGQTADILRQIDALLAEAGTDKSRILSCQVFLADIRDVDGMNRAWDAWLDAHFDEYREVMLREIESRVIAIAEWARWRDIPAVVGEGWVGYTPRDGWFEEGKTGLALAEHGVRTALEHGVWGVVPGSNAAPHHPMWREADWMRRVNRTITASARR